MRYLLTLVAATAAYAAVSFTHDLLFKVEVVATPRQE